MAVLSSRAHSLFCEGLPLSAVCIKSGSAGFGFASVHSNFSNLIPPLFVCSVQSHQDSGATCLVQRSQGQNIYVCVCVCTLSNPYINQPPLEQLPVTSQSRSATPTSASLYIPCHAGEREGKCRYTSIKKSSLVQAIKNNVLRLQCYFSVCLRASNMLVVKKKKIIFILFSQASPRKQTAQNCFPQLLEEIEAVFLKSNQHLSIKTLRKGSVFPIVGVRAYTREPPLAFKPWKNIHVITQSVWRIRNMVFQ